MTCHCMSPAWLSPCIKCLDVSVSLTRGPAGSIQCLDSVTLHLIICLDALAASRTSVFRLMLVCRGWRDIVRNCPRFFAVVLMTLHGRDLALVRAARHGREDVVKSLLDYGDDAPRADCLDGEALVAAAQGGHESVARLLLADGEHAPRADCQDGEALIRAAHGGHESMVRLLLACGENAPWAGCRDGEALIRAAYGGHDSVVHLLLHQGEPGPRANCQNGEALIRAAQSGHEAVARQLLSFPVDAPQADCQGGEALIRAARGGHVSVVRMLLDWKEHAPRADCRNREAFAQAAEGGHKAVLQVLLSRLEGRSSGRWAAARCCLSGLLAAGLVTLCVLAYLGIVNRGSLGDKHSTGLFLELLMVVVLLSSVLTIWYSRGWDWWVWYWLRARA